jgi:hypothetical protein
LFDSNLNSAIGNVGIVLVIIGPIKELGNYLSSYLQKKIQKNQLLSITTTSLRLSINI